MDRNCDYDFVRTINPAKKKIDHERRQEYNQDRREAMRTTATEYLNRGQHETN